MTFKTLSYAVIFIGIFILHAGFSVAQKTIIKGRVHDEAKQVLSSASVTLVDDQSTIINFVIANKNGEFEISNSANGTPGQLWLEVVHIGFKKQRKKIVAGDLYYNFELASDAINLQEISIKNRPEIARLGDTLRYQVLSFARPEDRSIGDVLRRMPGIEIAEDGAIFHNGKRIENLYIHGDDLMDGRYGLASKAIRKEMIVSVDVIKNHQPIKVLKDKFLSDKTAINLVLKDENSLKISAKAMIGAGLPKQYDLSITPILLNKHIKMINTLGLNNSGVDYKNDFKQLGASNLISNINNQQQAQISLSQGTIGPPNLPLANYYFNKSAIVNLNNILNAKNGLQFKVNIQGFIDKNSLRYGSLVENYLPNDTIVYSELQSYVNKPLLLNTSFNLMANRNMYFFNNSTKVNLGKESNSSLLDFNGSSFGQKLGKNLNEISNDLNWIPVLKSKGVAEVRWLISYKLDKQQLDIGEGYYAEIPNYLGYYDHIIQHLRTPTLFSNAYFAFKIPGIKINQEYKVGFVAESQRLNTRLNFIENEQLFSYTGDLGNNLKWSKKNIYFSSEYQLKYQKLKSTIQLPLAYQYIHYSQVDYDLNTKNKKLIFNPTVSVKYDINVEQSLTGKYKFSNDIGSVKNVYRGAILENYRTLIANHASLQEQDVHSSSLYYDFQKSITMLFLNAGISYDRVSSNTILSTKVTDNIQEIVSLPYKNSQTNLMFNVGVSKYLFDLNSTVSLKSQVSRFNYKQLINDEFLPFYNDVFSLTGAVNKKIFETINVTYKPIGLWNISKLKGNNKIESNFSHKAFRLDQNLLLGWDFVQKLNFEINAKHSYSIQSNNRDVQYFFLDMRMRHSNKRKGMDLNLEVNNLFNVKNYTLYSAYANQLVMNQYVIRGRMMMMRLDYYF